MRFCLERTARAVLAIWAAAEIVFGAIRFLSPGDVGPVDQADADPSDALPSTVVPMVVLGFPDVDLFARTQGLDRVLVPRVRTRLSGESETTTHEDDDNQIMVGV